MRGNANTHARLCNESMVSLWSFEQAVIESTDEMNVSVTESEGLVFGYTLLVSAGILTRGKKISVW